MMVWTGLSDGNNRMERCVKTLSVYFDITQSAVGMLIAKMGLFLLKCHFGLQSFLCKCKCHVLLDLINSHLNTECNSLLSDLSFLSMIVLSSDLVNSSQCMFIQMLWKCSVALKLCIQLYRFQVSISLLLSNGANLLMYNTSPKRMQWLQHSGNVPKTEIHFAYEVTCCWFLTGCEC